MKYVSSVYYIRQLSQGSIHGRIELRLKFVEQELFYYKFKHVVAYLKSYVNSIFDHQIILAEISLSVDNKYDFLFLLFQFVAYYQDSASSYHPSNQDATDC